MKNLNKLLNFLFAWHIVKKLWHRVKQYANVAISIGLQNAYHDIYAVIRKLWFFFIFQLFGIVAFIFLPQGKDITQCLLEDVYGCRFVPGIALLIAIWFWSLTSAFGARMLLYFTDSSNDGISNQRKQFRQTTQELIPAVQRIFPFLLFIAAFVFTYKHHDTQNSTITLFFIGLLIVYLINFRLALSFFFENNRLHRWYFNLSNSFENIMTHHLGNILFVNVNQLPGNNATQSATILAYINQNNLIPDPNGIVSIPFRKHYPSLFKRFVLFVLITLGIFLFINFIANDKLYYKLGTPALLTLGMSCWLITFYSIKIVETTRPFKKRFQYLNLPYTTLVFLLLLLVSLINSDHPINYKKGEYNKTGPKYNAREYLASWLDKHPKLYVCSTDSTYIANADTIKVNRKIKKIPLIFIGAEGGAFRTGAFTALLLGGLQDSIPEFRNRIFAYSTVSGGTFGANLFNGTVYQTTEKDTLFKIYRHYFEETDFIAPIAAKLMFGDFINYFIPKYFEVLDREVALEQSWTKSWDKYLGIASINQFDNNFYDATTTDGSRPIVLINSTEVEYGRRAIISNIKLDTSYFNDVFDLNKNINGNISYATSISLSARFPLISPAGKLDIDSCHKVHLVDGGYYENYGNTSMMELLNAIRFDAEKDSIQIIPMMIQTVFDADKKKEVKGISMLNEITEIVQGIYNVRSGHTHFANILLKEKIKQMGGKYIEIPVANSKEEVPNNWVLSQYAVTKARIRVQNSLLTKGAIDPKHKELMTFLKDCGL